MCALLDDWKRNQRKIDDFSGGPAVTQCSGEIRESLFDIFEDAAQQTVASGGTHPREWKEPTIPIVP